MKDLKKYVIGGIVGAVLATSTMSFAASQIKLIVNGNEVQSDVPPQIINGRTMVPIAAVAKALGAQVQWDGTNRAVIVNTNSNSSTPTDIPPVSNVPSNSVDLTTLGYSDGYNTDYICINQWGGTISGKFMFSGTTYNKGIGFDMSEHGDEAEVTYTISHKYSKLEGLFGTDDQDKAGDSNQLIVLGDGKEIYRTPLLKTGDAPVTVNVDISNVTKLTLKFETSRGKYPVLVNPILQ